MVSNIYHLWYINILMDTKFPFFFLFLERRFHTLSRGALKTQLWYLPLCARNKSIQRCTT